MTEDVTDQAWAWFEAMDRSGVLNRLVADSLLSSPAIQARPALKNQVNKVINLLAAIHDECAASMHDCSAPK